MDGKLYVGNLPFTATEEDLRALFEQAGQVTAVDLIKDRDSGRSKGFAFVTMATQVEAEKAITTFNGYSLNNRELKVNIARPREESSRDGGYGGGQRYGQGGGGFDRRRTSGPPRRDKQRGGTNRY